MKKNNKKIWYSHTLGKWLEGIAEENKGTIEYVTPIGQNDYIKAIDKMIKENKKKKVIVYLNGIPTIMLDDKER